MIIRPKHHFAIPEGIPYFYLIGPVRGGGDWQHQMCLALARCVGECAIATPTRWQDSHPLAHYFVGAPSPRYERQRFWEDELIELAQTRPRSCLVVYLPEEDQANPRAKQDGPYGRDTYREIGRFRGLMEGMGPRKRKKFPLAFGGSPNFSGINLLQHDIIVGTGNLQFPFRTSISATADQAMAVVFRT